MQEPQVGTAGGPCPGVHLDGAPAPGLQDPIRQGPCQLQGAIRAAPIRDDQLQPDLTAGSQVPQQVAHPGGLVEGRDDDGDA